MTLRILIRLGLCSGLLAGLPVPCKATILLFENIGLPPDRELLGLQSVKDYGDSVTGPGTGGYAHSFARGNGWTPNILLDYAGGKDRKTVCSWRDEWDGKDGANYLLDGDDGGPFYYWYTFTPRKGAGVHLRSLDLECRGDHENQIVWRILAGSRAGEVLASGTTKRFRGDKADLLLGMTEAHYGVVVLELVHTGTRTTLAVDNLNFDEAPADQNPTHNAILEVGTRKQLLVDDYLIAKKVGITRQLSRPTKENGGKPIFEGFFYGTVLFDENKFKMWHRGNPYGYAESKDGYRFTPMAKLQGLDPAHHNTASFFIDPHESDPAHRYKICYAFLRPHAAALGYSADGINWKAYNKGRPVTHRAADTYNQITWDEEAKVYRLFTRTDYRRPPDGLEVRGTRDMTNPDIKADPTNWKTVREWKFGKGAFDEVYRRQIYALTDWMHEGVHFALMSVYENIPKPGAPYDATPDLVKRHEEDIVNFYIGTARGNEMWDLSWVYAEKPMIERGPDGSFDKDMIFPASSIVTHADKHWLYYNGYQERHGVANRGKHGIGLATLPLDRFIAQVAAQQPGTIETKPFRLQGDRLVVNADARRGALSVELLDEQGKALGDLSSKAENFDDLRREILDQTSLAPFKGQVIRLRFTLRNAKLYAFQTP